MVLVEPITHFHVWRSDFENTKWILNYKQKCICKKKWKYIFTRNTIISKPIEFSNSIFDTTTLMQAHEFI